MIDTLAERQLPPATDREETQGAAVNHSKVAPSTGSCTVVANFIRLGGLPTVSHRRRGPPSPPSSIRVLQPK
jgi:hypothetical protein